MEIAKNPFQEQIMRCSALQRFPLYPEGIKELREALKHSAGNSMERARKVIDALMADRDTCPSPHEIRAAGEMVRQQEDRAPDGCEICRGQAWVSIQVTRPDINGIMMTFDGAKRCDCTKGQWFRQKDRENDAKRAAGLPV